MTGDLCVTCRSSRKRVLVDGCRGGDAAAAGYEGVEFLQGKRDEETRNFVQKVDGRRASLGKPLEARSDEPLV